ncbi:MAG: S16 family serine protease [Patescibacteria group bacterium]
METIKTIAIFTDRVLFPLTGSRYTMTMRKGLGVILNLFLDAEKENKKPRACLIYAADARDKAQKMRPLDDWEKNSGFYKIGTFIELSEYRIDPNTGELSVETVALSPCEIKNISPISGANAGNSTFFDCEAEIIPLAPPLFPADESGKIYEWELNIFRNSVITVGAYLEHLWQVNPDAFSGNQTLSFLAGVDLWDIYSVLKVEKALYEFLNLGYTDPLERQQILEFPPHKKAAIANKILRRMLRGIEGNLDQMDSGFLPALPDGQNGRQNGQNGHQNGQSEVGELRERFEKEKHRLPEEVQKIVLRYLKMVEGRQDSEAKKYIEYINYILDYPFGIFAADRENFSETADILNKSHYKLEKVKEEVLEFLAAKKLNPEMKGSILCLIGPAGVGKTSIGKSIAEALGRPFARISLGGVRDEAAIRGHSFTYVGSKPGRIVEQIKRCGVSNPVFMIDEIDKVSQMNAQGNVEAALLEVLDPEQNNSFEEHYLGVPIDLSQVLFVATGNVLENISGPLKDRMRIIHIPGYTIPEQVEIAKGYLIPRQMKQNGLEEKIEVLFSDEILKFIIENYTFSPGVRMVEQKIETILRKIAKKFVMGENLPNSIALTEQNIIKYLGQKRIAEKIRPTEIGEAIGLAVTGDGRGGILFVQTGLVPLGGKSEKIFSHTGNLNKVIEESEKVALSLVRMMMLEKNGKADLLAGNLLHIHLPDGATPKDGPSAGITITCALYSLFSKKPVKENLVMTGEIDLKGRVLPVGGIKEKLLAAVMAGAKEAILPEQNRVNYEELSDEIKQKIQVYFAEKIDKVIKIAFGE